ncbi:MAG: beta strand repeat-containing protein [Gemmatimonadaceae bacterium]
MTPLPPLRPRRRTRRWTLALLGAVAAVGLSCGDDGFDAAGPDGGVVEVRIAQHGISLIMGDSLAMSAVGLDKSRSAIDGRTVSWASSEPAVAAVDGGGMLHALTPGVTVVTAEIDGRSDSATVTVLPPPVDRVSLAPTSATIILGQQRQLAATTFSVKDSVLVGRPLAWSSDNTGVATVDAGGTVSGVGVGSAVVTVTSEGKSATAAITVIPVPVKQVVVTPSPAVVQLGGTLQLAADTRDSVGGSLAGRAVAWSSAASGTAAVSQAGLLSGVALGATTVTATSEAAATTIDVTVAAPIIALGSTTATFSARHTGPNPAAQTIAVTNGGPFTLGGLTAGVSYAAGQPTGWLAAGLDRTTAPATLTLQPTTGSLAPGTYNATVTVASSVAGVASRTVAVTFTVAPFPVIQLSTTTASFVAQAGGTAPASQAVTVTNVGTGTLSGLAASVAYAAGQPTGWLTATLGASTAPTTLTLQASTAVPVGSYTATVTVSSSLAGVVPRTVTVTFTAANGAAIAVSSTSASFTAQESQPSPTPQVIDVTNAGVGTLSGLAAGVTYTSAQTGWLAAALASTTAPTTLTLTATTGALPVGTHTATVTLTSSTPGVPSATIAVSFVVTAAGVIATSPTSTSFAATRGSNPASQGVNVTNSGGGALTGLSASVVAGSYTGASSGWLDGVGAVTLSGSTAPATLTIAPQVSALVAGTYGATVRISSAAPGVSSKDVPVTVTVQQPQISLGGTAGNITDAIGTVIREASVGAQSIAVGNAGAGTLSGLTLSGVTYSATGATGWITGLALGATSAPTSVTYGVNTNVAAGAHSATFTVSSPVPGVAPRTVTVTMTVQQPTIAVGPVSAPPAVGNNATSTPGSSTVSITNGGAGGANALTGLSRGTISYGSGASNWIAGATLNSTTSPATLTITYNPINVPRGTYTATIPINSTVDGAGPVNVVVTLTSRWLFADVQPLLTSAGCGSCHGGIAMNQWANIVGQPATYLSCAGLGTRVVAGDPNNSLLYRKITSTQSCGGPMTGVTDTGKIAEWILDGAKNTTP